MTYCQPASISDWASARAASGINPRPRAGRDEKAVEAAAPRRIVLPPRLQIADSFTSRLDDPRVDRFAVKTLQHLLARERLVVPVAGDLGIGVPGDEQLGVVVRGRPHDRQPSVYRKSHITVSTRSPSSER